MLKKKSELSSHIKIWRKLKCILFSERSHSEKAIFCMIPVICRSGKGEIIEILKRSVIAKSLVGRREK